MIIKKKAVPDLFAKVLTGKKTFDLRLARFNCQVGDTLLLQEWDPKKRKYTGREIAKKVTFVLKTKELDSWSKKDIAKYGYIVMALK